jgi:hypothetical protein
MQARREHEGVVMSKTSTGSTEVTFGRRTAPTDPGALVESRSEAIERDALRRLHYAAAIACGVFAALVVHITLTVFGFSLNAVLQDAGASARMQFVSALAWWGIGAAAFVCGWAAAAYLIAAARERTVVYRVAQRALIAVVFGLATTGGVMSKSGGLGDAGDVAAGLTALALGLLCAYCGARLAYLNAEQL